jgi:hypothetical protein
MKDTQLALHESQPPAITQSQGPNIALMLQGVIDKGVTAENAQALTTLCDLFQKVEAKNAEREFNAAFVALQSKLPVIVATSVIPNRGKYERFEDIMRVVGPLLQANGFAVSFEQSSADNKITVKCHLRHLAGHSSVTPFTVRLGGRADSETQADCKASTTAKRNSLLQALNIVIRQDIYQSDEADATIEGGAITASQAADLRALCEETKSDKAKFLAFAGADTFEEIAASRFADLAEMLNRKRK